MKFKTRLLRKEEVAKETIAFHFEKPAGFEYRAGQTLDVTLIDPPEMDAEGAMRTFSMASAPEEETLMIATRLRDTAFKRVLRALPGGGAISMEGPIGNFVLHERSEKVAVFLVGGIGITPFRSMMLDATKRSLPHHLYLFYSNRTLADAPFYQEIIDLPKANPRIHVIPTMTEVVLSDVWKGEHGYITAELLDRNLPEHTEAIYYLAGPIGMVAAMHKMLLAKGISNDDIRIEEFTGY